VPDTRPTAAQTEAIPSWNRGDVCVVAGPGSGKTRVLVDRFRWLVTEKRVPVRRILAITFTEKAAANMKRRLAEALSPQVVERASISTIHAFCARLLRENAVEAAVDPEFRVLDAWEADFELRRAIEDALNREHRDRPERVREFLRHFGSYDVPGALYSLFHALRAAGVTVEEARRTSARPDPAALRREIDDLRRRIEAMPTTGWRLEQRQALQHALDQDPFALQVNLARLKSGSPQRETLKRLRDELVPACLAAELLERRRREREWFLDALALAARLYRESKRDAGALDFADLEEGAIRLLEAHGPRLRSAFSFILMDEFQDTNPLQARLVELLRGRGNFFAVGDINQSIYGFRHADPTVFRDFREQTRESGGHVVEMVENFRSRPEILRAAQRIVAGAEGVEPQNLAAGKNFPPPSGPCVEVLTVQDPGSDEPAGREARHVAARIRALVAGGEFGYGEIAVLLRSSALVRVFEKTLREQGVPVEVTEGRGFFDAGEVNDLLAFLRAMANPRDEISLATVLRSPLAGVSDDTLVRLKAAHGALIEGVEKEVELAGFRNLFRRLRSEQDATPIDRLLVRVLGETGYEAWLWEQPGGAHRVANVRKLLALARRFQAAGLVTLSSFLDRVEGLRREEAREADARPPEQSSDAVQVMTIHAAKGLEFPAVFVASLGRGSRGDMDPAVFLPDAGVGMRWRDPETGDEHDDAIARSVVEELKRRQKEEENRLLYVAMTRAERLLVLSASFGETVKATHWLPLLQKNLELDFKTFDNQPRDVERGDIEVRLLQTDQEPAPEGPAPAAHTVQAAPIPVERPAPGDQSDAAVSATSVALFAQCPRKYYLSRYLGFSGRTREGEDHDEADETDPSVFGREVHALLAGALPGDQASEGARDLSDRFHASPLGRRASAAARVEREQGFLVVLGDRLVSGQIDLWFQEGGETVLVDYKTDQVSSDQAAVRAADYGLQLGIYALAIERLAGVPVDRAVLYFLRPDLPVEVDLDLAAARSTVEELHQAQSRIEFPLNAGPHCRRCPHFGGLCPAALE
jgi:ATP-dependent exoDNAse (exonuclease V) beta subunit